MAIDVASLNKGSRLNWSGQFVELGVGREDAGVELVPVGLEGGVGRHWFARRPRTWQGGWAG